MRPLSRYIRGAYMFLLGDPQLINCSISFYKTSFFSVTKGQEMKRIIAKQNNVHYLRQMFYVCMYHIPEVYNREFRYAHAYQFDS